MASITNQDTYLREKTEMANPEGVSQKSLLLPPINTLPTMEDPNLIAFLFPSSSNCAWDAIQKSENRSRYVIPEQEKPPPPDHRNQVSTVSTDDGEDDPDPAFYPGLQLAFDHGPKIGTSFVIGTDPNSCDIVLPARPKIIVT